MENILIPGGKLELNEITANKEKNTISYLSQIYDIDEDTGRVSVAMPYSEGRMVVLSIGTHYNAYFYCKAKMYHSKVKVVKRYKADNLFVLVLELETSLKKVQRRQFFRYDMIMPVKYMPLDEALTVVYDRTGEIPEEIINKNIMDGQTIDISGGGMKFVGCGFKKGDRVYIEFDYMLGAAKQSLKVTAQIIDSVHPHDRKDIFHNRASFVNIKNDDREALIRFIFEEERKRMQLERRM